MSEDLKTFQLREPGTYTWGFNIPFWSSIGLTHFGRYCISITDLESWLKFGMAQCCTRPTKITTSPALANTLCSWPSIQFRSQEKTHQRHWVSGQAGHLGTIFFLYWICNITAPLTSVFFDVRWIFNIQVAFWSERGGTVLSCHVIQRNQDLGVHVKWNIWKKLTQLY